jgi:MFS family permease
MTNDLRTCQGCGYQTTDDIARCPQCKRPLMSARRIRRLGWMLLFIGLFLMGLMGTITLYLAPSMLQPGRQVYGGSRFTGTAQQGISALMLFGTVILFGLTAFINGLWQVRTGRRNKWLLYAVAAVGLLLLGTFWSVYSTFD